MKIAICDDDVKAIDFLKAKIEFQGNRDEVRTFFHAGEMTPEKMSGFEDDIKGAAVDTSV